MLLLGTSGWVYKHWMGIFYPVYYKTTLWGRQKFIVSCGGAPLNIIQEYIKNQDSPQH